MSSLIKISESTSLALHSLAYIASKNYPVKTMEISKESGASSAHLSKVLQWLVKSNLVKSGRGPRGGFVMKASPLNVTLYDIFVAMEGSIDEKACPLSRSKCPFRACIFDKVANKLNREFLNYLKSTTIEDFIKRNKKGG